MIIPLIDFVPQMYRLESIIINLMKLYRVTINRGTQCHAYIRFFGPKRTDLLRIRSCFTSYLHIIVHKAKGIIVIICYIIKNGAKYTISR
jgi:hypothetical protein